MKKILIGFLTLFFMTAHAEAQRFLLSGGAGWMPSTFFRHINSLGGVNFSTAYPTYQVNFTWNINPKLLAAASAVYEYSTADGRIDMPPFSRYHQARYTYGGLLGLGHHWINRGYFALYSSIECGIIYSSIPSASFNLRAVMQIDPLGFRIGKKAGGFMELGYGIKGIISAGVFVRW